MKYPYLSNFMWRKIFIFFFFQIGLFNQITLEHCPGLVQLVNRGEEMADLMKLSPESILLRWVNYHLERAGVPRRITNFTSDIKVMLFFKLD